MSNIEHQRWSTALSRVAEVERHSRRLRSKFFPRTFTYSKRSTWATEAGFDVLPIDQQHELPAHGEIRSRVRAESVLIGKFDVEAEVRLRAFYPDKALSVRYQTGGERNGITRTVKAHEKVHPYAPELMPTIYDHGTIRNGAGAYLVEDTVVGESATRSQLESMIVPLAQRLRKVHQGVGIRDKHLSRIVGGSYKVRWSNFVETQNIDATIDDAVQRLIDRNDLLEVSLTHGDLVNSNILVNEHDFVLVDWEFAEMKPIAFDMSKMIINARDLDQVVQDMHSGLGGKIGTREGYYTFREQIALSIVLTLSWHKNHLTKAKIAKRTEALARQTSKRLNALERLLEIA
ncbi:phosphotransferase [Enteractinococcus coprophilus]|uniref:Phosphotransferase family enzyme n=1 Tax=Enteractinococcus coprophilus TaxID=1027633 RepID=A0A543AIP6_9MICC|nr:phosphotransferase [Enteractinococcus coprophilus]TQL72459.1 phosphotransferase family enzyme [Enteractinococcus coprophilus]